MATNTKIAIIGCGPSGMAALAAYSDAEKKGVKIPEIICFEKQPVMSGLWNFNWRTGVDEHGEYVHNSMYRGLWTNTAKEIQELANYTYDEHFKKPIPSYPSREVFKDYLEGRARKYNIERFVYFNTVVRHVEEMTSGKFSVLYENLLTKHKTQDEFDYVIVASGHFSVPNFPIYPGFQSFPGRIMHGHDFRNPEEFAGQRVLVLGSSYTAEDIALQNYKYGAKHTTLSYRTNPLDFKWPENVNEVPELVKVSGKECTFKDGTTCSYDSIILATGYQHHFPFMADNLRLQATNIMYVDHLYKGVHFIKNPKVLYMGMQNQIFSYPMFDVQAWYIRDYTMGKIKLPLAKEMAADIKDWFDRGQKLQTFYDMLEFQASHVKLLMEASDYPNWSLEAVKKMWLEWYDDRKTDIVTYRDKPYTSHITGTKATKHHTEWKVAKDSSYESFVGSIVPT